MTAPTTDERYAALAERTAALADRAAAQAGAGPDYAAAWLAGYTASTASLLEVLPEYLVTVRDEAAAATAEYAVGYFRAQVRQSPAAAIREATTTILEAMAAPKVSRKTIVREAGLIVAIEETEGPA